MANRRFEMYQYRQILVRMRMGESNRAIANSGLMGRKKAQALREKAILHGWLDPDVVLPDNDALATALEENSQVLIKGSSVAPYADKITKWYEQGIQGTTIHQALVDKYGFTGSYWSVIRYLKALAEKTPVPTTVIDISFAYFSWLPVDWHQYGASSFALNGATILAANGTTPFAPNRST